MHKNKIKPKKLLSVLLLSTLIFTFTFRMNSSFIHKDIGNNLRTSEEYDPAGLIALWSGPLSSIPAGWKLSDGTGGTTNTSNRFVYSTDSMESPGATGGTTSHNHSYTTVPYHDHGVTSTTTTLHTHNYPRPIDTPMEAYSSGGLSGLSPNAVNTGADSALHSHNVQPTGGTDLYMSDEEDFIPPYYEMAFIEKETDDPIIPIGLIVMWAGDINSIPSDWELCDGSNGTPDLREKFIRGVLPGEDPGNMGGNLTHNHKYTEIPIHSHSMTTDGALHDHIVSSTSIGVGTASWPAIFLADIGYTDYADVPHSHDINEVGVENATTQDTDNLPPYFKVAFIMNTLVSNSLPLGVISIWGDSIGKIPSGWNQCNGTDNTPNLLNRYPRGIATGEQPGIVGGSDTHRHIYTDVPLHSHTVLNDTMTHRHSMYVPGTTVLAPFFSSRSIFYSYSLVNTLTTTSSPAHNHTVNPTGSLTSYTSYENSLPSYVKLIYIIKSLSISNPSPSDGVTGISYNPILSVDIYDLDGDDLKVSFYNASDNYLIDVDIVLGGTGTASVIWSGLSSGISYSWYVEVNDSSSRRPSDTWSFTTYHVPEDPLNPTPNDGAVGISYSPILSVDVFDNDGDDLTVSFYDASDDSIIDTEIVLGGSGTASVIWSGLSSGTSYSWYATSDDGPSEIQSPTWSFTTNHIPDEPTNPTPINRAVDIGENPILIVDVSDDDGDVLTVTFYNSSDNSVIDAVIITGGSGTAAVTWSGVSSNMICAWYAIADDGLSTSQSPTWTFTTIEDGGDGVLPAIPLPGLVTVGLIVMGTAGIISVITYLKRKKLVWQYF